MYNTVFLLSGAKKRSSLSHHLYQLQINVTEHKICVLNRSVQFSTKVLTSKAIEWYIVINVNRFKQVEITCYFCQNLIIT